jgi:hypothetical protein
MALPILQTPIYTIKIPSTGKEVKIRPFLVREEKALLLAQTSEDMNVMIDTLKEIAASCIKDEIDVNSLAIFDLEYIFTQLRARSVGEYVDLLFYCDTCDDPNANKKVTLDISKLAVTHKENHNKKIALYNDVGIMMKYPPIETLVTLEKVKEGDVDAIFDVIVDCVDYIYTKDELFHAKEQTREELTEFLNSLTQEQFKRIESFFETMPKLSTEVDFVCPVCNKDHHKVLEGVESFF